jgi:hypothetical protein
MSKLTVSLINTENDTTPLVLSTGNTLSGFIKVETANSDLVFSGNTRFLGGGIVSYTIAGSYNDSKGNLRDIPVENKTNAHTLAIEDMGKTISITTGGVTVPSSVFAPGNAITIYNNSASDQTITQGASVTMYLGGTATTGNRTLAQRGIATVLCVATDTFVISGAGLT